MTLELPESDDCIFCAIVAGDADARWEARPEDGAEGSGARVACFHNQLMWARVMLLIVPVQHMTQQDFWSSDVLADAASLAVKMGGKHCGDDGYRVISNFGRVAHQSQVHAHLHVVSGTSSQIDDAARLKENALATEGRGIDTVALSTGELVVEEYAVDDAPLAVEIAPAAATTQLDFWRSEQLLRASQIAFTIGEQFSPAGFRLVSSFDPVISGEHMAGEKIAPGQNPASLFLLGGGQLGLYV